ncbi:MAG: response regulator [Deltaproteobacteria bacterium]|nr:response regulator [Deltaproteobacteria bacterium]
MTLILINEANIVSANYMADTLKAAGYETRACDSQIEALAIYQERRPELVFTNYYLAHGSGISFLKALKKLDPSSMVVFVTGIGSEQIARDALIAGAYDYVVKNVDFYRNLPLLASDYLKLYEEKKLREQSDEARVRLDGQVELAGWLDHNFKNILSATMGSLALIDFSNEDQSLDKKREYLKDSLDSVRTAVRLLDRLSEMGSGGSNEDAGRVLVSQVVDAVWENVKEQVEKAPPEESRALVDLLTKVVFLNEARALDPQPLVYDDLFSILNALIMNALEALVQCEDTPTITVRAKRQGLYLVCEVKDNGRGMDARTQRHAFEPLFSTKGQVGVGVSLAIVQALVLKHKGEVSAQSTPRKGSSFRFTYYIG